MNTVIVIFIVLFALSAESASHKKHKSEVKASDAPEGNSEWPHPDVIRSFEIPPEFTENPSNSTDENDETTTPNPIPLSGKHHGKSHHKSHTN